MPPTTLRDPFPDAPVDALARPASPGLAGSVPPVRIAVISSTTLDLPAHRPMVRDACIQADYFPAMMEFLPAADDDAIAASMALVERSDVYIGIYATRYGHIPRSGQKGPRPVSITEMEFDRALERGMTILAFLMDEKHPIQAGMVESNATAQRKLAALKRRVCEGRQRKLFQSPEELKTLVVDALNKLRLDEAFERIRRDEAVMSELRRRLSLAEAKAAEYESLLGPANALRDSAPGGGDSLSDDEGVTPRKDAPPPSAMGALRPRDVASSRP